MSNSTVELFSTPPEVARILRKDVHWVLEEIRSGRLKAVNLGNGTQKPRYRVSQTALDEFLQSRLVVPPSPRQRRQKRAKPVEVDYVAMMNLGGRRQ